ncbi:hypothetical protein FQZ97_752480 [compost metagenome]
MTPTFSLGSSKPVSSGVPGSTAAKFSRFLRTWLSCCSTCEASAISMTSPAKLRLEAPCSLAACNTSSKRCSSSGDWISLLMISGGAGRLSRANQSFLLASRLPKSMCCSLPMPATRTEKPTSRLTSAASRKALGEAMNSATRSAGIRLLPSTSRIPAILA